MLGYLTAASIEQQRSATPLVPPHPPPPRAAVLDMPYADFKRLALGAIDPRCVLEPLRSAVDTMGGVNERAASTAPSDALVLSPAVGAIACIGLLGAGIFCAVATWSGPLRSSAPYVPLLVPTLKPSPSPSPQVPDPALPSLVPPPPQAAD